MKKLRFLPFTLVSIFLMAVLSSCLNDDNNLADYSEWKALNDEYIAKAEIESDAHGLIYEKFVPVWDNNVYVLMRWHNDRAATDGDLTPISNSTIRVKYTLTNIEGDTLDSSASFNCQPNSMITGFWTAVTNMHVKDTVTAVMPYTAAYGAFGSGSVLPYSTLIFGIRLDSILSYEKKY